MIFEENSQGYFRIKLPNGRYLRDEDTMLAISGNHVSKEMVYTSYASALQGAAFYMARQELIRAKVITPRKEPEIAQDWKFHSNMAPQVSTGTRID
jgi:hypothetical protein